MPILYGDNIIGVDVIKKSGGRYFTVGDMGLKRVIVQAAQRKAYYENVSNWVEDRLISQVNIDWADTGANHWSGDFLYLLGSALGKDLASFPSPRDVIKDTVAEALSDGSTPWEMPGQLDSATAWFSSIVSGCQTIKDLYDNCKTAQEIYKGVKYNEDAPDALGDVLKVVGYVDKTVSFQKELWEWIFKCQWQARVIDQYRSQLEFIRANTTGATSEAIGELLNFNSDWLATQIGIKTAQFIGSVTWDVVRDKLCDVIKQNPYGRAVLAGVDIFYWLADFTSWDDTHADAHIAMSQQSAEANFHEARYDALAFLSLYNITPDDLARIATAAKLWYTAAGDFYDSITLAGDIVEHWPTADSAVWNGRVASWRNYAAGLHTSAASLIPEIGASSNTDTQYLLSRIRETANNQPSFIQIGAYSPVALLVTAEDGRRIGYDPVTQTIVNDFWPDGGYTGPGTEPQLIRIPAYAGSMTIQVYGTGNGSYRIEVLTLDENSIEMGGTSWTGSTSLGQLADFQFDSGSFGDIIPVDPHAPEITVTGVADGSYYTSSVTPVITVSDDNLVSSISYLNGALYTSGTTVVAEDQYTLTVRATDGINVVYKSIFFAIDQTSPVLKISGFVDGGLYGTAIMPLVEADDQNLYDINIELDGSSMPLGAVYLDGDYAVSAIATDFAGHTSSCTYGFTIDTTAPSVVFTNLADGDCYQSGLIPQVSVSDIHLRGVTSLLDGDSYILGTPISQTMRHRLTIESDDAVGNHTSKSICFIVIPANARIILASGGSYNCIDKDGLPYGLVIPAGALSDDIAVVMDEPMTIPAGPVGLVFAGHTLEAKAESLANGNPVDTFNKPLTITINYSDADIVDLDESTLKLFYWEADAKQWQPLPSVVNTELNFINAYAGQFTVFAIFGQVSITEPKLEPPSFIEPVISAQAPTLTISEPSGIESAKEFLAFTPTTYLALLVQTDTGFLAEALPIKTVSRSLIVEIGLVLGLLALVFLILSLTVPMLWRLLAKQERS